MKSENKSRFCGISIGKATSKGIELVEYEILLIKFLELMENPFMSFIWFAR